MAIRTLTLGDTSISCIRELGRGQQGTIIYEGNVNGRSCAVKVVAHKTILEREIVAYERLKVQHNDLFLQMLCHGQVDRSVEYLLAFSHTPSIDLQKYIQANGVLKTDRLVNITSDLSEGLVHLKALSILHGDIKPENILIDTFGCAKFIDFGNACDLRKGKCTIVTSNLIHRSPASILDVEHGSEADTWALGVLVQELVSTEPYFSIKKLPKDNELRMRSVAEIHRAHIGSDAPEPLCSSRYYPKTPLFSLRSDREVEFPEIYEETRVEKGDPKPLLALAHFVDGCLEWVPKSIETLLDAFRREAYPLYLQSPQ